MINRILSYFNVSRRESRGIILMFLLFIIIYAIPYIYQYLYPTKISLTIEELSPVINNLEKNYVNKPIIDSKNQTVFSPFTFNPNTLSDIEDWKKLGFTEKQVIIINNYRSKGGKFFNKEDLKKIYTITENQYNKIEQYIDIPAKEKSYKEYTKTEDRVYKTIIVDINTADSLELLTIKGIGPAFSSRILKRRNALGGFVDINQLKEIYGIDSLKFLEIKNQIKINTEAVKPIMINEIDFDNFKSFPYLSYKQKNAILAFRKQHGDFKNMIDLEKIKILDKETLLKIAPYVKF